MQKVAIYIRHSGTRQYEKAIPKNLKTLQGQLLPGAIIHGQQVRRNNGESQITR
jgi:hypothetical protein